MCNQLFSELFTGNIQSIFHNGELTGDKGGNTAFTAIFKNYSINRIHHKNEGDNFFTIIAQFDSDIYFNIYADDYKFIDYGLLHVTFLKGLILNADPDVEEGTLQYEAAAIPVSISDVSSERGKFATIMQFQVKKGKILQKMPSPFHIAEPFAIIKTNGNKE